LAPSTGLTKDYLPRLAGTLNTQPITDIISIENDSEFKRPIYAGNAIAKVRCNSNMKILSIRPTNFDAYKNNGDGKCENF
jgi:electron transfer flavoprotein alpha subunit